MNGQDKKRMTLKLKLNYQSIIHSIIVLLDINNVKIERDVLFFDTRNSVRDTKAMKNSTWTEFENQP